MAPVDEGVTGAPSSSSWQVLVTSPAISLAAPSDQNTAAGEFHSVLFASSEAPADIDELAEPDCFPDLNLDQIVAAVIGAKQHYTLAGFFHAPLDDVDAINYRQEVFRDLEQPEVYDVVAAFASAMRRMREKLTRAAKSRYHYQKQRWFLDAAADYCAAVAALATDLAQTGPASRGLRDTRRYLEGYVASSAFVGLRDDGQAVRQRLDAVRYNVLIKADRVTVGAYDDEPDYASEVTKTFERFQQRAADGRPSKVRTVGDMDHIEAQVLEQVARLFPDLFASLDAFCHNHAGYPDSVVGAFDREIQFFVAYLDYIAPLRRAGLTLSYPVMSAETKDENVGDTFDLALATQLVGAKHPVVRNDVSLTGAERILVVSGPNNGGKTTLARTIGQLHYLAKLGCPVPGRDVRLFLCDAIYTHFEEEEDIATLAGKLQEELNRMHADFARATPRSLMIMNEMFSSTTVQDALFLSKEMLARVSALDALCVCVTFLDELATFNDKTVSMVSTVVPDDPATRTFKLIRQPADGKAFAKALAEKYGLTYETLKGRVS